MFLEKLLPKGGLYCVAMLLPSGGFRHYFYPGLDAAVQQLEILDKNHNTVYIAQAVFDKEKVTAAQAHNRANPNGERMKVRSQANAVSLKNFFLDIDCGPKWPLKSQKEGAAALKAFVAETSLPMPTVVNSGNGLYAHWVLTEAIAASKWQEVARVLKQVVATYAPAIGGDSSRTSDSASVLRAPGTWNRKPGKDPKPVAIVYEAPEVEFLTFVDALSAAARKKKIERHALLPPKAAADINAEFALPETRRPSYAGKIASECAQLNAMRETQGNIPEPLWYSCLGLLVRCEDGQDLAQEWSSGHPGYDPDQVEAKMNQWLSSDLGASTCANFGDKNPAGCIGCKYNGKLKSPIVLGYLETPALELQPGQLECPPGFRRTVDGLQVERDGQWYEFYPYDLYLDRLCYDESVGYEVMAVKHHLPHEGNMECVLRSSLVNDPKALLTVLYDAHIKPVGVKNKTAMVAYMEAWQAQLTAKRRMTKLLCQMGWKERHGGGEMIVLGRKIFHADGSVEDASMARSVPEAAKAIHSAGSLAAWSEATRVFGRAGMEPFAFALLAGGFGSMLMRYTGFRGGVVSLAGQSGAGKTLMLCLIASIWGKHSDLIMLQEDTRNMLISRLGVLNTLPMVVDELTNQDPETCSNFVYQMTQGREKGRLDRNAVEKRVLNHWQTIAVTSSNTSLVEKIASFKQNSAPEVNRIFEYWVSEHPLFKGRTTEDLFWMLDANYGHAGEQYARWLVTHSDAARKAVQDCRDAIATKVGIQGDERFWLAMASVAYAGGMIASHLGLIKFDVKPVMQWAARTIQGMRKDKVSLAGDAVSVLGQFIDAHTTGRLIVKNCDSDVAQIIEMPRGALVMRYEADSGKMFISRPVFRSWITKAFGSFSQARKDLIAIGALKPAEVRKVLGGGTHIAGAAVPCWELDMRCKAMGNLGATMAEVAEVLAKAPVKVFEG